jgi:hypothetical protein
MREAMLSGMKSGVAARESSVYSVSWVYSVSGVVSRWRREASGVGEGERDRSGYSVAGVARSRREVVGCGEWMVEAGNSSVTMVVGTGAAVVTVAAVAGPVRTWEGRICWKPCARATCSMSLKYWERVKGGEEGDGRDGGSYLDSLDLQLQRRIFVADDHRVGVQV